MSNPYVVVRSQIDSDDLEWSMFDDYDNALEFVNSDDCKCIMVKVENICEQAFDKTTVVIEDHT